MNFLKLFYVAVLAGASLTSLRAVDFTMAGTVSTSVDVSYSPPDPEEDQPASVSNTVNLTLADPLTLNGAPTAFVVNLSMPGGTKLTLNPEGLDDMSFGLQVLYRLDSGSLGSFSFGAPTVTFWDDSIGASSVGAPAADAYSSYSSSYSSSEFGYVLVGINSASPVGTFSFTGMTVSIPVTSSGSAATLHLDPADAQQIYASDGNYNGPASPPTALMEVSPTAVPEPATTALIMAGVVAGMVALRRRGLRRSSAVPA